VELAPAEKPPTTHIARVETTVAGPQLEIFRLADFSGAVSGAYYFGPSLYVLDALAERP